MTRAIGRAIRYYGAAVQVVCGQTRTEVRAMIQPVTQSSWRAMQRATGGLGDLPTGQYLYLGPADTPIGEADRLECGGRCYSVRRDELICLAGKPLYRWGLLTEQGGDDPWNS